MAVFVEGQTEQIFVRRLLTEIAGSHRVAFSEAVVKGRQGHRLILLTGHSDSPDTGCDYYIMICNCGGDEAVASVIKERYDSLSNQYSQIVGLRDVYPSSEADLPQIRRLCLHRMPTKPISPRLVLAVLEVEAWFIGEETHFDRLDPGLSVDKWASVMGFDPRVDRVEAIGHPADFLGKVYSIAGLSYSKSRTSVERTVHALDYGRIYLNLGERIPAIKELIEEFDLFFT